MFQFSPSHRGHPLSACAPGYINQVSILALAQRASKLRQYGCLLINRFNSRPRTEGIRCSCSRSSQGCCFNSRPRTEGIAHGAADGVHCRCFNSRPRTEGIGNTLTAWSRIKSFNSRPRTEGIYDVRPDCCISNQVSILALAQRASLFGPSVPQMIKVSILALAQRASAKIDKYFHPILRILHNISTFGRITPLLKSALYPIWLKYRNIFCANLQDKSQRLGFAHSIHAKSKHNYPILLICQFFSKCFYS